MKKEFKKIGIYAIFIAFVGVILISGCKKSDEYVKPTIPPENAFAIDFNAMDTTGVKTISEKGTANNFIFAGINVLVWSVVINTTLFIPVTAYKLAISQVPEQVEDNEWLWSYSLGGNYAKYTADLTGKVVDEGVNVEWQMNLSYDAPTGGFSDFVWYTGTMNAEITNGQWILREGNLKDWNFIQIDWNRDTTVNVWDIRYTNIKDGDAGNGDYIFHGYTADAEYNAFFSIYDKSENNLVEIQWHRTNNNGRVKNLKHFGDDAWHYWDEDHLDI